MSLFSNKHLNNFYDRFFFRKSTLRKPVGWSSEFVEYLFTIFIWLTRNIYAEFQVPNYIMELWELVSQWGFSGFNQAVLHIVFQNQIEVNAQNRDITIRWKTLPWPSLPTVLLRCAVVVVISDIASVSLQLDLSCPSHWTLLFNSLQHGLGANRYFFIPFLTFVRIMNYVQ